MYILCGLTILGAVLSCSIGVHAATEDMNTYALPDGYTGSLTIDRDQLAKCAKVDIPSTNSKPVPQSFVVQSGLDDCANPLNVTNLECGVQGSICISNDANGAAEKALGGGSHVEDINWCKFDCSMSCMFLIVIPPIYAACVALCCNNC